MKRVNNIILWPLVLGMLLFTAGFAETAERSPAKEARKPAAVAPERSLKAVPKVSGDSRKRVALVVGNSRYASAPLKNPVNDARAMAATLRKLGFEVEEKTDLGYAALNKAVEGFGKRLATGGVGLFYYAGHGIQVNGANYLLPVDVEIEDENEVRYKAVDAGLVLAKMEQARSDVNLVVLDACRNNPFARSFRSASRGLASMDAPSGSLLAYATAPGRTAADGSGGNGVYTEELLKAMAIPGLAVEEAFKRVRRAVMSRTGGSQVPWESSSLTDDFRFIPTAGPEPVAAQEQVAMAPRPPEPPKHQSPGGPEVDDGFEFEKDGLKVYKYLVVDTRTGLQWLRDGNTAGREMNWNEAMQWVKTVRVGGHSDWRLPTKEELEAFAKSGGSRPADYFNANGFRNVQSSFYWSSSSYAGDTTGAWGVYMYGGYVNLGGKYGNFFFVWPVRTGQQVM